MKSYIVLALMALLFSSIIKAKIDSNTRIANAEVKLFKVGHTKWAVFKK